MNVDYFSRALNSAEVIRALANSAVLPYSSNTTFEDLKYYSTLSKNELLQEASRIGDIAYVKFILESGNINPDILSESIKLAIENEHGKY